MKLEELNIYQISMNLGEQVWKIVDGWDNFEKFSMGKQLVSAVDSIAANIAEGFGRFHYKDAKNFYYYAEVPYLKPKLGLLNQEIGDSLMKKNLQAY